MSIETGSSTVAPRPVEKSASPKAQAAAADDAGGSGPPTFLSLLTAMEPDAASPADDDTAAAEAAAGAQDAVPQALSQADAAALLAQNLNRAGGPADTDLAALAGRGEGAGVPHQMAALTGAADQAEVSGAGGRDAHRPGKFTGKPDVAGADGKPAGGAGGADLAEDAATALSAAPQRSPNTQTMLRHAEADRAAAQESAGLSSTKGAEARANESHKAADLANADWRTTIAAQGGNASAAAAPMADALGAFSKVATSVRAERPSSRPLFVPAGSALAGSWSEPAVSGGNAANGPTFAPTASMSVPEAVVAEKLSYWISRGVQNAELQLDAFGGGAVKVNIAVQGNEAQVEFRSDQPEARKLLQDAMPQLRDMLRGEGMELSGGFVGGSAQQDSGAQERRGYPQGTRSAVVNIEAQAAAAKSGLSRTPGRAVDLFV